VSILPHLKIKEDFAVDEDEVVIFPATIVDPTKM
jgi:hypothetical protein